MKFGFVLPGGSAAQQVEQARAIEAAGWDAVFVWEAHYGVDAWTLLGAMAVATERVRLGTMLTPLPWRRPWKLASQVITLDDLSGGRAILAVGVGAVDTGLGDTGEPIDLKERASRLDEGIDVVAKLWAGEHVHSGEQYKLDLAGAALYRGVRMVQSPRIPIWCVGIPGRPRSMRRILRCDGLLPQTSDPEAIRGAIEWLDANGGRRPGFDVIQDGETPPGDDDAAASIITPFADAGATWWLESRWDQPDKGDRSNEVKERIAAGPPVIG